MVVFLQYNLWCEAILYTDMYCCLKSASPGLPSIDRDLLLQVMSGYQTFKYDLKTDAPFRAGSRSSNEPAQ